MATIVMFGNSTPARAAQAEATAQDVLAAANGTIVLQGQYAVAMDLKTQTPICRCKLSDLMDAIIEDTKITLSPTVNYSSDNTSDVSPMARMRGLGWRAMCGDKEGAFISINTIVGLLNGGQLAEVRVTRSTPKPNGRVSKIDHVVGKWGDRNIPALFAVDVDGRVEQLTSWIERQLTQ